MKVCSCCKRELPDSAFSKRTYSSGKVGLQSVCKECATKSRKQYYKPYSSIRLALRLTQEDVDRLTSPGKCEVCGTTEGKLCIDHCHDTKKPRGLLCHNCNTALGLLGDDVQIILGLSQYLAQSEPLK